jgi:signal recognition particle subunit SRP54
MFESLTEKLNGVFSKLTGRGRLAERDVDEALRQVRMVLLEADVNLRVARDFVAAVRERAIGKEVLESLTPGQQVKIVHDELNPLDREGRLTAASTPPSVVMLVGLQARQDHYRRRPSSALFPTARLSSPPTSTVPPPSTSLSSSVAS